MKGFNSLKETLAACEEYGFCKEITYETLWNEGYGLGRRRWYWGPMWFVDLKCWLKTRFRRK
jgi:hypothetical protein